ncbi:peptidase family M48-domain-containing protein [Gorgonomyces haynaldii]|nr:peptidase family M48-domain-containing protein [Gorgonomyces haynaldii]
MAALSLLDDLTILQEEFQRVLDHTDFKQLLYVIITVSYVWETFINLRQHFKLYETQVPKQLQKVVSTEDFDKARRYSLDKSWFGFVSGFYAEAQAIVIFYFDLLPQFWNWIGPSPWQPIIYVSGVILSATLLTLPLSIYSTFVIEQKHGFNKQTFSLFLLDKIKTFALTLVIGMPFLAAFLYIIDWAGSDFVFYVWVFVFSFQIFLNTLFPTVIQPLFNKFTPLQEGELKEKISHLCKKIKFPLDKVLVIDGSSRSAHSNAYFYGLFKTKRIVLYDTLLENQTHDEIIAILAHELGHWHYNHLWQRLLTLQIHTFCTFYSFGLLFKHQKFYSDFGFSGTPTIVGFMLFMYLYSPFEILVVILMNALSRKNEFEADQYAKKLGYGKLLQEALIKISTKNQGNFNPDWLYSVVNYSHPPLVERLKELK